MFNYLRIEWTFKNRAVSGLKVVNFHLDRPATSGWSPCNKIYHENNMADYYENWR